FSGTGMGIISRSMGIRARGVVTGRRGRGLALSLAIAIFSLVLAGCGGAGGGSTTEPTPTPSANLPAIVGLTPASGPLAGNTAIEITGSSFKGATVTVGGRSAAGVSVNSEGTRIDAVVPAGQTPGPVDVVVKTAAGSATSPIRFTYNGSPTLSF